MCEGGQLNDSEQGWGLADIAGAFRIEVHEPPTHGFFKTPKLGRYPLSQDAGYVPDSDIALPQGLRNVGSAEFS